jgi:hypothetical protein
VDDPGIDRIGGQLWSEIGALSLHRLRVSGRMSGDGVPSSRRCCAAPLVSIGASCGSHTTI